MMQVTSAIRSQLLEQCRWEAYWRGYSNCASLDTIKAKIYTMDDCESDLPLTDSEMREMLVACQHSIAKIDSYDYKLNPVSSAELRMEALMPILELERALRAALEKVERKGENDGHPT